MNKNSNLLQGLHKGSHTLLKKHMHSNVAYFLLLCNLPHKIFSLPFFPPAYRLKKCPLPPIVENAEMIYEDEDFHIGSSP